MFKCQSCGSTTRNTAIPDRLVCWRCGEDHGPQIPATGETPGRGRATHAAPAQLALAFVELRS